MPSITHPRQLVLITSRANKDNITATTLHMPSSHNPQSYSISLPKSSFSSRLIKESKVFVVNFILDNLKRETSICMKQPGEQVDKFKKTELETEEAEKIDCLRLKHSAGYLECEVMNELETGDHIMFIANVVNSMINKKGKRLFLKEEDKYTTTID